MEGKVNVVVSLVLWVAAGWVFFLAYERQQEKKRLTENE